MVARDFAHTGPAYLFTIHAKHLKEQKAVVYTPGRL
jgi:hypothetical protein